MGAALGIGLVGDQDETIDAHRAIPWALTLAGASLGQAIRPVWLHTETLLDSRAVDGFDALWCVPGSPYRNAEGALRAIRFARDAGVPFLGTCGGMQHALIEYARHVLGWSDAAHEETAPGAGRAVVSRLACELVEASESLDAVPGSRIARAYGNDRFEEAYRCRFGLNPQLAEALLGGPLRAAAHAPDGQVRAVELDGHPFFVATLFQPERVALAGRVPPLVRAWLGAAAARRTADQEGRSCC